VTPLDRVNARANVGNTLPTTAPTPTGGPKSAFSDFLRAQMDRTPGVRFSAHAQQRLDSRAISLSPDDQQRISRAVDQARPRARASPSC
jgi:hypothetical protein